MRAASWPSLWSSRRWCIPVSLKHTMQDVVSMNNVSLDDTSGILCPLDDVSGTTCLLSKGRNILGPHHPWDAVSKGRNIRDFYLGTHCSGTHRPGIQQTTVSSYKQLDRLTRIRMLEKSCGIVDLALVVHTCLPATHRMTLSSYKHTGQSHKNTNA